MVLTVAGKSSPRRQGGVNGDLLVVIDEERNPRTGTRRQRSDPQPQYYRSDGIARRFGGDSYGRRPCEDQDRPRYARRQGPPSAREGTADVNGYGTGDLLVVVDITVPAKLSAEEKRLVEQLAGQPSFAKAESVKNQNIFERMKNFFQ